MLDNIEMQEASDKTIAEIMRNLNVLAIEVVKHLQQGKSFIFEATFEGENNNPFKVAGVYGNNDQLKDVLEVYKRNSQEIIKTILEITGGPKKKGVNATLDKKEDGSVIINFNN